jgi:chaperone required for assembly of F1-ATPase
VKRFWEHAAVVPYQAGYALVLDGKLRHTPAGKPYLCPTLALAEALAGEWQQAPQNFDPRAMPIAQLVATAHDLTASARPACIERIMQFGAGDQLCFRAAHPVALAGRQQELWQPYLDWALTEFDALLLVTESLLPPEQPPQSLQALRRTVETYDDYLLTALEQSCSVTGSLVLALALTQGWQPAAAVFQAAELEAHFQTDHWGADPEAIARLSAIESELLTLERFCRMCRWEGGRNAH